MATHYIEIVVFSTTFDDEDPQVIHADMYMLDGTIRSYPKHSADREGGILTALYRKHERDAEEIFEREYGRGGKWYYEEAMDELNEKYYEKFGAEVRKGFGIPYKDSIWFDWKSCKSFDDGNPLGAIEVADSKVPYLGPQVEERT